MKQYSELRKIDSKGRIIVPSRMLLELGIHYGDDLRVILEDDHIEIRPFEQDYNRSISDLTRSISELQELIKEMRSDLQQLSKEN